MADQLSALVQALNEERQQSFSENPWIRGGQAVGQMQMDGSNLSGPERFALQVLQGLGSGLSTGYGKAQAESEYKAVANPILQALNDESQIAALSENPDTARFAPILQAYNIERKNDQIDKLNTVYNQQGLVLGSDGRPRELPGLNDYKREGLIKDEIAKKDVDRQFTIAEENRIYGGGQQGGEGQTTRIHPERLKLEQSLAKDFQSDKRVQKFEEVDGIFRSMLQSNSLINKQADNMAPDMARVLDLDLVVGTAKILDPTSVAREGEVETVKNTGTAISSSLQQLQSQIMGGTGLTKTQRDGLIQMASQRRDVVANGFNETRDAFANKAKQAGLDPSFIARGQGAPATSELNPDYISGPSMMSPSGLGASAPATAVNPSTGETLILQNGQWVRGGQ